MSFQPLSGNYPAENLCITKKCVVFYTKSSVGRTRRFCTTHSTPCIEFYTYSRTLQFLSSTVTWQCQSRCIIHRAAFQCMQPAYILKSILKSWCMPYSNKLSCMKEYCKYIIFLPHKSISCFMFFRMWNA